MRQKPTIVPLRPESWDRLATLFAEGGDPRWCWCMYWRLRSRDFGAATVSQHRAALRELAAGDPAPGLVALDGDRAVGWVSLGPRQTFERLERSRVIPRVDDAPVWSIVCFAVSATARGRGIAAALLDGAVAYARECGATTLEAYPVTADSGSPIHPDAAYTGSLAMFERAGFRVVSPTGSTSGGSPRVVVRRAIA